MRREKLEHLGTTGMIDRKRSRYWDRLIKWLKVGRVTDSLKAMRDRDA